MKILNKLNCIIVCVLFYGISNAQQVVASSGGVYSNAQGSLSVTIGQSVATTVSNNSINLIFTQGFQQPSNQSVVVPLQLIEFTGKRTNNEVKLQWKVLNELDIKSYTLLRSLDGRSFESIGLVDAKNNGQVENLYNFIDANTNGKTVYYKIFIQEKNGNNHYSWIVSLSSTGEQIKVYPNPVVSMLYIQLNQIEANIKNVQLIDVSGKVVYTKLHNMLVGQNLITIDVNHLAAGTYFLIGLEEKTIKIIKD